jgi:hypothetical protein
MWIVLAVLLLSYPALAAAPTATPTAAAPTATDSKAAPARDGALDAVKAVVKPWHTFKDAWVDEASVIAVADYRQSTYPCVDLGGGRLGMPIRTTFIVKQWLKGAGAVKEFDASVYGHQSGPFPHDLLRGRTYLVFMKPRPESLALLNDPKTIFRMDTAISTDEFLAVIDLTQTKEEADAENVVATKSGTADGYEFTPAKWEKLRQAKTIDFAEQGRTIAFIEKVVLRGWPSVAEVRSYLGPPDYWYRNEDGVFYEYRLNLEVYDKPRVGAVFSQLELRFSSGGSLQGHSVTHYKYTEVRPDGQTVRELTADERRELGIN